jgi:hypothetical protein
MLCRFFGGVRLADMVPVAATPDQGLKQKFCNKGVDDALDLRGQLIAHCTAMS